MLLRCILTQRERFVVNRVSKLVAWHSGRTWVFDQRTFHVCHVVMLLWCSLTERERERERERFVVDSVVSESVSWLRGTAVEVSFRPANFPCPALRPTQPFIPSGSIDE